MSLHSEFPPSDSINYEFTGTTGTVVHVLDSYVNFNITGSMTFENIEFRGENALAAPIDPTLTTFLHPPMATIPSKKCRVTTAPDGKHTALGFTLETGVAPLVGKFACSDSTFEAASIPMKTNVTCAQTNFWSTTIGSVRSCSGEPYHSDFFTFDTVTHIPYKRHRVLFNLYNWDPRRSYSPQSRASLTLKDCKFEYFLAGYEALINVENNNMAVVTPSIAGASSYIEELGDDRGVKIKISGSSFKNSRFCKGMLVYKRRPKLESTFDTLIYALATTNTASQSKLDDSLIDISETTFSNLNFGRVLKQLSLVSDYRKLPITGLTTISYPAFDNHGSALNL